MPPKKQNIKTEDIRTFFRKSDSPGSSRSSTTEKESAGGAKGCPTDGAGSKIVTSNDVRVKKENDGESTDGHSHTFIVKFSRPGCRDSPEYSISCDRPRTVLQAIQSVDDCNKEIMKFSGEKIENGKIIIQLGEADRKYTVATHFPCSCISDDKCLIMSYQKSGEVEEDLNQHDQTIYSRDIYSVFHIDTVGGDNAKKKKIFKSNAVKKFKFLCVYGEEGMTVEEALRRDGRFVDDLGDFTLSDNGKRKRFIPRTQKVDRLDQKELKICLPQQNPRNDKKQQESTCASNMAQQRRKTRSVPNVAKQTGISVRAAVEKCSNDVKKREEIYEILRQQFPELKKRMESRFTGDSYQEILKIKRENFGKIQQSFSEVHRVKKLLKLGESVCKVIIENVGQGTGFVLFDNFILTNGHLFKDCVEGGKLRPDRNVFCFFNYEDPEPHTNYSSFQLANLYICFGENELDYAVLELNPECQKPNQTTQTKKIKVPPGLLKEFGPLPQNGEACIIGHPAGEVKKIDTICIIEKEERLQAINDHLSRYRDNDFTVLSISSIIKNRGIDDIMMGGKKAENVTYDTFMYHGSSGSPVFEAHGKVFGLHTGGYVYGFPKHQNSVIEYAQPLLTIFEHFVSKLKESKDGELLERVKKEAKRNVYLQKLLSLEAADTEEPAESDEHSDSAEPMETD